MEMSYQDDSGLIQNFVYVLFSAKVIIELAKSSLSHIHQHRCLLIKDKDSAGSSIW